MPPKRRGSSSEPPSKRKRPDGGASGAGKSPGSGKKRQSSLAAAFAPGGAREGTRTMAASVGAGVKAMKVCTWNVNGLRALMKKGTLGAWMASEKPDVLFLNETKLQVDDEEKAAASLSSEVPGYSVHWNSCTAKKGYSGTAVLLRDSVVPPGTAKISRGMGVAEHDAEGRVTTVELPKGLLGGAALVGAYVPNSGMKLERLGYRTESWDPAFRDYLRGLGDKVLLTGDLNVAHLDIDCHDPKSNKNKTPGFCDGERDNFSSMLSSADNKDGFFHDVIREHEGDEAELYSFWSYRFQARAKNKGWRLDYVLLTDPLAAGVEDAFRRPDVTGSDHVPVGAIIKNSL